MTAMFLFASIPMLDARSAERRPEFAAYAARTRRLVRVAAAAGEVVVVGLRDRDRRIGIAQFSDACVLDPKVIADVLELKVSMDKDNLAGFDFTRAEHARSQRENSAAGAEIERVPRAAHLPRDIGEETQTHRCRRMRARAERNRCRNQQPRNLGLALRGQRALAFRAHHEHPPAHTQRRPRLRLELARRERLRFADLAAELAHECRRFLARDLMRLQPQRAPARKHEHHQDRKSTRLNSSHRT